ncbi:hypothetical protein ACN47E_005852 [Coniothyrium glycines]
MSFAENQQGFSPLRFGTIDQLAGCESDGGHEQLGKRYGANLFESIGRCDRPRLVRGLGHLSTFGGEDSTESLPNAAKALIDLHEQYNVTERFLRASNLAEHIGLRNISTDIDEEFDHVDAMIEGFIGQLREKHSVLSAKLQHATKAIAEVDGWWEATNIFHQDFTQRMLGTMFEQNAPKDPQTYGHYISNVAYTVTYRPNDCHYKGWVFRIFEEIMRVAHMPSGSHISFNLLSDLLLHVITSGSITYFNDAQTQVVKAIHSAIRENLEHQSDAVESQHVMLSQCYRRLRNHSHPSACYTISGNPGICNLVLPTVILLQHYARHQVQANVLMVCADRLPLELAELVATFAIRAEKLDGDLSTVKPFSEKHPNHHEYNSYASILECTPEAMTSPWDQTDWRLILSKANGFVSPCHSPMSPVYAYSPCSPRYSPVSPASASVTPALESSCKCWQE